MARQSQAILRLDAPQFASRPRHIVAFATKHGYAASNPIDGIERPEISDSEIKVLSASEALKLINEADEDARPVLAIGLFAGLRMSEILALNWEEVDLCDRTITVQGRKTKTRKRRVVTISDNLHEWLALTATEERSGPIWKRGFWGWYNRRLAFEVPRNALRHSFGSYHSETQYRSLDRKRRCL